MDFAECRFMCCRENQRCCGCCFHPALRCNRMEVSVAKEKEHEEIGQNGKKIRQNGIGIID